MQPRIRLTTISQSVRETKRPNPLLMESLLLIAMTGPSGTVPQSPQTVSAHKQIRLRRRQTREEERRREKTREDERRREKEKRPVGSGSWRVGVGKKRREEKTPAARLETMGFWFSKFLQLFGEKEARILVLGLDNAGKTTILCKRRFSLTLSLFLSLSLSLSLSRAFLLLLDSNLSAFSTANNGFSFPFHTFLFLFLLQLLTRPFTGRGGRKHHPNHWV